MAGSVNDLVIDHGIKAIYLASNGDTNDHPGGNILGIGSCTADRDHQFVHHLDHKGAAA